MRLLFLTNLNNGAREEDDFLVSRLTQDSEIIVVHPMECEQYLDKADKIIIRNIWPTHEYLHKWKQIKRVLKQSGIFTFNSLEGKGDNEGKSYLLELYMQGYPVIPSIDSISDLPKLPQGENYWIKPKDGADGYAARKISKHELEHLDLTDYIIQPYVEFIDEPSFFFINSVFAYAITMPNRIADTNIQWYEPTSKDMEFARKFVQWNDLPHGIQRIDALRLKDGSLLLTEVEDIAPYLYLLDLPEWKKDLVIEKLLEAIK